MLKVNNVEVIYSDVILVLKGLSLAVPEGEIVALLGANGAGKSTTLKAISGCSNPRKGGHRRGDPLRGEKINGRTPRRSSGRGSSR